jgi:hypothetical protein
MATSKNKAAGPGQEYQTKEPYDPAAAYDTNLDAASEQQPRALVPEPGQYAEQARSQSGPLRVKHTMVGDFMNGEILRAKELARFSVERLEELLDMGALEPVDEEAEAQAAAEARPAPAEDVAAAEAASAPPPQQDFDQRAGQPTSG